MLNNKRHFLSKGCGICSIDKKKGQSQASFVKCLAKSIWATITRSNIEFCSPSMEISRNPTVKAVLGKRPIFGLPIQRIKSRFYVGWGRKSGLTAASMAKSKGGSVLLLEDGFLRSFHRQDPSLSIVLDDLGIYYDAFAPSRLELLIGEPVLPDGNLRIEAVLDRWRSLKLSKYNAGTEYQDFLPDNYVLVVDQVKYDASIKFGMATTESFDEMLKAAIDENPNTTIVVKVHPDVFTRSRSGHFNMRELKAMPRVKLIANSCLPSRLVRGAQKVYTVTSQLGFEALIWGKPVRCFGMPFYASWGLTLDHLPKLDRRKSVSLNQLAMAALISYPRYLDPDTGEICEVEKIMDYLEQCKNNSGLYC